jgi:hypothetical protein
MLERRHCDEAAGDAAIHLQVAAARWIASSLALLAMTTTFM